MSEEVNVKELMESYSKLGEYLQDRYTKRDFSKVALLTVICNALYTEYNILSLLKEEGCFEDNDIPLIMKASDKLKSIGIDRSLCDLETYLCCFKEEDLLEVSKVLGTIIKFYERDFNKYINGNKQTSSNDIYINDKAFSKILAKVYIKLSFNLGKPAEDILEGLLELIDNSEDLCVDITENDMSKGYIKDIYSEVKRKFSDK